ncbi:hypothetical protein GGI22_006881, partial [Coemansia erecta]
SPNAWSRSLPLLLHSRPPSTSPSTWLRRPTGTRTLLMARMPRRWANRSLPSLCRLALMLRLSISPRHARLQMLTVSSQSTLAPSSDTTSSGLWIQAIRPSSASLPI